MLRKVVSVISTDLYDHGYGTPGIDLFTYKDIDCSIITNPPFGIVTEFIEHMLDNLKPGHKMALFLKLQFLEGQDRYKKVFSRKQLKTVYLYSKRVACYKKNEMFHRFLIKPLVQTQTWLKYYLLQKV